MLRVKRLSFLSSIRRLVYPLLQQMSSSETAPEAHRAQLQAQIAQLMAEIDELNRRGAAHTAKYAGSEASDCGPDGMAGLRIASKQDELQRLLDEVDKLPPS